MNSLVVTDMQTMAEQVHFRSASDEPAAVLEATFAPRHAGLTGGRRLHHRSGLVVGRKARRVPHLRHPRHHAGADLPDRDAIHDGVDAARSLDGLPLDTPGRRRRRSRGVRRSRELPLVTINHARTVHQFFTSALRLPFSPSGNGSRFGARAGHVQVGGPGTSGHPPAGLRAPRESRVPTDATLKSPGSTETPVARRMRVRAGRRGS